MRKRRLCLLSLLAVVLSAAALRGAWQLGFLEFGEEKKAVEEFALSNPNADPVTRRVYDYLCGLGGKHTLSAQQESTWMGSPDYEMDYLQTVTGKLPAMRGLDYMHDDFAGVNERAMKWWQEGGLVTICWHTGWDFFGEWKDAMGDTISDWEAALTPGTPAYETLIAGMDKGAEALKKLQEAGVPVLWRPFHEFDGKWFWWGKGGQENFKRLWRLMYTRYTEHWGLNNLIWVLGYSHMSMDYSGWYPGDDYVDVIGADSYQGGVERRLYVLTSRVTNRKPFAFHECGKNPTAEELATTPWAWFMTWHTEYVTDHNKPEALTALYNSEQVITKDKLPVFSD